MGNIAAYFQANRYKHQYNIGDRVRGRYHGIPFSGTVMIDNFINEDEGPFVIVDSDLPIKIDNRVITMIKVKHKDLQGLEESYVINRKTNKKK
jgi:hypothetical protein